MSLPLRDPELHTYGDYCTWPDDQRFEIIDGVAYAMAPAPTRQHQRLAFELARAVADALDGSGCEVNVAPFDVRLPDGDEADAAVRTVVQPDISVVCDPNKLDDKGCRGAPDWLVEVLSPKTAGHDQVRKLGLYERHGVKEYWLVHPVDRVVTIYRLADGTYGRPVVQELRGLSDCRACPGVRIDWELVVKGLPDVEDEYRSAEVRRTPKRVRCRDRDRDRHRTDSSSLFDTDSDTDSDADSDRCQAAD